MRNNLVFLFKILILNRSIHTIRHDHQLKSLFISSVERSDLAQFQTIPVFNRSAVQQFWFWRGMHFDNPPTAGAPHRHFDYCNPVA